MLINILFLLPVLVVAFGLFFDNGVFFANLFVVPLISTYFILKGGWRIFSVCCILFLAVLLYLFFTENVHGGLYFAFEILAIAVMLIFPSLFFSRVKISQLKFLGYISIFFVVVYFFMALFPAYWVEDRYMGPLQNTNLSVYFLLLSLLFLSVSLFVRTKIGPVVNLAAIGILFFAYKISQSRSIFFFLPVFFYLFMKGGYLRHIIIIGVGSFFVFWVAGQKLWVESQGRFDSDETSFVTRAVITDALLNEMVEAKGVPKGPRYTTDFVVNLTKNPEMHAHNDLLSGVIDYGVFFFIAIVWFSISIIKLGKDFWFSLFCLFAYISCALHGYLFGCVLLAFLLGVIKQFSFIEENRF